MNNTIAGNGNEWAGGININSNGSTNIITGVKILNTILWNNAGDGFAAVDIGADEYTAQKALPWLLLLLLYN